MPSRDDWISWAAQSINDSGRQLNALTIGFVALLTYVLVTTASIDHGDILIGRKVVLPILKVSVYLHHFFWFVALFIITFHVHILLHLAQLRTKVRRIFSAEPETGHVLQPDKVFYPYPVVWLMLPRFGDRDSTRRKIRRSVIRTLFLAVYVAAPLGTLAILQLIMLPSHRTFLARCITGAMFIDALAIAIGLPLQFRRRSAGPRRWCYRGLLVGAMVVLVAIDFVTVHWPFTVWSWGPVQRHLSVSSLDLQEVDGALNLRGRDLRGGHFVGIDLSRADLRGADLRDVDFTSAVLEGATLLPAGISRRQWEQWTEQRQRAEIERIQAEACQPRAGEECEDEWDKNLSRLEGANFSNADLTGANLALTRLSDVNLNGATLTFADLSGAMAHRADMDRIQADHAKLFLAQLDGVSASHADLWKADLRGVSAVGTSFLGTDLGGAQLGDGVFQAAVMVDVDAQAADFTGASLQGADLRGAKLMGATGLDLQQVIATHADLTRAEVDPIEVDPIGGQLPHLVDLRAAQQDDLAHRGPALIVDPELVKGKDYDDVVIQPYPQSILVDPQGWPKNPLGPRGLYCKMAYALQTLEAAQQEGSVPGSYLDAALDEIARGERVPRIRALEKALRNRGFCPDAGSQ